LELIRLSIEQGFDSQETISSIGTQLQEEVIPLENNARQDVNLFLDKYYDYREKILNTYRTFYIERN